MNHCTQERSALAPEDRDWTHRAIRILEADDRRSADTLLVEAIERFGGRCHFVDYAREVYDAAQAIADEAGGYYLDQSTHAERATDWRGDNNAERFFRQMEGEEFHAIPAWVAMSAGTGGTSATLGRLIRYRKLDTRLCAVDVEGSAFYEAWQSGDRYATTYYDDDWLRAQHLDISGWRERIEHFLDTGEGCLL